VLAAAAAVMAFRALAALGNTPTLETIDAGVNPPARHCRQLHGLASGPRNAAR
jgi:hypothetical protein